MSTDSHGYDTDPAQTSGIAPDPRSSRSGVRSRERGARSDKAPPRRRRKARLVHRVVRHLDIWSLAKIGAVYVACAYVVALISGFILWRAADIAGTIDGIEGFMEDTGGYDTFEMRGEVVFSSAVLIGAVLSVLAVCLIILAGILFNLISDLTGGIRMTVIDEDLLVTPARRGARPRRYDRAPAYDPDPVPESAHEPAFEPSYADEPIADEPGADEPGADEAEVTTAVPSVAVPPEAEDADVESEARPAVPSRSWVEPEPEREPVTSARSWDEPEPESESVTSARPWDEPESESVSSARSWDDPQPDPAPVPSFRDDAAPSPYSPPTEPAAESAEPVWPDPVVSASDPVSEPADPDPVSADPDPEPVGDVDPAFDRLVSGSGVAGSGNESSDQRPSFGSWRQESDWSATSDQTDDPAASDETDQTETSGDGGESDDGTAAAEAATGDAESSPQDEDKPRFEIDFG